jgi:hypothetical protein
MFETLLTMGIVFGAVGYIGVKVTRAVRAARAPRDSGCGSSCGCDG